MGQSRSPDCQSATTELPQQAAAASAAGMLRACAARPSSGLPLPSPWSRRGTRRRGDEQTSDDVTRRQCYGGVRWLSLLLWRRALRAADGALSDRCPLAELRNGTRTQRHSPQRLTSTCMQLVAQKPTNSSLLPASLRQFDFFYFFTTRNIYPCIVTGKFFL